MSVTLKGYNDFYEGWVDGVLGLAARESTGSQTRDEIYSDGYAMARETRSAAGLLEALRSEIALGHVIAERR